MSEKAERKRLAILRALQEANGPMGSAAITERLLAEHYEISERTVRHHLGIMDRDGLTDNQGRRGRRITQHGLEELGSARVIDRIGVFGNSFSPDDIIMHYLMTMISR